MRKAHSPHENRKPRSITPKIGIYRTPIGDAVGAIHESPGGFATQNRIAVRRYFVIFLRKINKFLCNLLAGDS
jgi:hypothetical protein